MTTRIYSHCIAVLMVVALSAEDSPVNSPESTEILVQRVRQSLVTIRATDRSGDETGIGTGFVIDADGLIATNLHVINEGRPFSITLWPDRLLQVIAVEASEPGSDLAIVRVATDGTPLPALVLADKNTIQQGATVLAFGNPLGLQHSVVQGVLSALREIDGVEMLQLAMPIEFGNSGGPLVDRAGLVHGVVNMKSAVDENLGFAIPVAKVRELLANPNPVRFDRWTRIASLPPDRWQPLFGASWRQRSGVISVSGVGRALADVRSAYQCKKSQNSLSKCRFKSDKIKSVVPLVLFFSRTDWIDTTVFIPALANSG